MNCSEVASFKDKKDAKKEFESAKRHLEGLCKKDIRFKLTEHTFLNKNIKLYLKIGNLIKTRSPKVEEGLNLLISMIKII